MTTSTKTSMKNLSKSVWTNLKTGIVILAKEICWMAGGLPHKMEVRQLQKQAKHEEAAYGRRILEALQEARQNAEATAEGQTLTIPTPKDAEAIGERILFIREEIKRLEQLRRESRTRHEANIRTRYKQDEKEAEAAEPVVLDMPDVPYNPEDYAPESTPESSSEAPKTEFPSTSQAPKN